MEIQNVIDETYIKPEDPLEATLCLGGYNDINSYSKSVIYGMYNNVFSYNSLVCGRNNDVSGNNNIVLGHDIKISGDDNIIIGKVDLIKLLKRIDELEQKIEHLWWMPGGPECQKAETHFKSLVENGKVEEDVKEEDDNDVLPLG